MSLPTPYYEEPGITIFHADCRDILPHLPKVDLVLTDPPYGVNMSEGFGGFGEPIARRQYPDQWDESRPHSDTFKLILSKCQSAIIFGGNFFADVLPQSMHWLVWDKLNTMPIFGDCELAWTNINRKSVKKKVVECILIEAEEKYCEIAVRRLQQEVLPL